MADAARGRPAAGLEQLEGRLALSTTVGGTITQGNLYGGQSVVLATPIQRSGQPTAVQVIDTGDIGMAQQTVRTFTPFPDYSGSINLAVGDFLHRGYHQLIAGTGGGTEARVAIFDLFRTFADGARSTHSGVFTKPMQLQVIQPFKGFTGGVSLAAADFDNDGVDDFAVGAAAGGTPRVSIYSQGRPAANGTLPATPRLLNSFNAFDAGFRGGVTLAAGHLTGASAAELIVGMGTGGGTTVNVYRGGDVISKPNPSAIISYQAFGSTRSAWKRSPAIQVQLVESIVHPDDKPVTKLDAQGRTGMFTPADNPPLARGTIVAYAAGGTTDGRVSLYSMVTGKGVQSTVTLPNTSASGKASFRIHMTPIGYLFNKSIGNPLAPTVLVADPVRSTVSLYSLSGTKASPVKNIYTTAPGGTAKPKYDADSFPFGAKARGPLTVAVKLLESGVATRVPGGTSGMLPSRQVAYQSPFRLQFKSDTTELFSRYGSGFFNVATNQSSLPVKDWYDPKAAAATPYWNSDEYGPDLAAFGQSPTKTFPRITSDDPTFWRESMVAAGLQFMNRGVFYQYHHIPAWWGTPAGGQADMGDALSNYGVYCLTPAGMQTPGLDCSDFSALVTNMVTGEKIKEGIAVQATVVDGKTQWGTSFEGTADIFINNDPSQGILSWVTLAAYFRKNGALATYGMLNKTLQTGDLLYYGSIPTTPVDPSTPLTISHASHVTIWTGQTLAIPGRSDVAVPLIMDSHGGNVQVGVDADNRPIGVVEPAGPQLRAWFVPTVEKISPIATTLAQMLPAATQADQNYYYFTNFTHAVRIRFPRNG